MSHPYNTDGLLVYPPETKPITMNALESIECTITFDVSDWSTSRRDAWIYLIVFGWDEETEEIAKKHRWDSEDIERGKNMHEQWTAAKQWLKEKGHK